MSQPQGASSNARDAAEAELRELGAHVVGRHHEAPQQPGLSLGFLLRGLPSFQASVAAPSRRPPRKRSAATRQQELAADTGAGQEDEPDAAAGPWQPVTMERLRTVFHLPREQAAQELGLGLSSLKRCCATTLNIQRWPHRKLQSLMGLMQHHVKNPLPEPEQQELMSLIQDEYNATLLNPDHELNDALLVKRVNKYKKVYSRKMTEIQRQRRMQENAAAAVPAAPAAPAAQPAPARRASSGKQPQSTCRHEELNMGVPGVEAAAPHAADGAAANQLLGTAAAAVKQEPQHACSAARVGPVGPGTAHVSPSIGSCSTGQSLEAAGAARAAHGPLAGLQLHALPTFPSLPSGSSGALPAAMAVDDALPAAKKRAGAAAAADAACPRASTRAAAAGNIAVGALAGMALPAWPAVPTSKANFTLERGNTSSAQGSPRGSGKGSRARRSQPGGTAKPVTLQQLGGPWGMGLTRTQPLQDPPSFQLWSTQHGVSSWGVAGTAMDGGLGSMNGDALPPPSSLLDSTGPGADGHQVLQQRGSKSVGGHHASVVLPKAEPLVVDGQPLATHPRLGWSSAGGALGVHSWDPSLLATYPSAQPQQAHEGWVLSSPRSAAAGAGAPTQLPLGRVVRGMHAGPLRAASVLSNVTVGYDSGECGGGLGYSVLTSGGLNSFSSTEGGPELHVQQQLLDLQVQELQRQLQQQEQQQQVAREGMATSSRASGQPSLSYMVPLEHGATQAGLCTTLLGTGPLSTTVENELESGTAGSQTMPGTARTPSGTAERPAAAAPARGAHALLASAPVLQIGTSVGTGPPSGSDGDASSTAARLPVRNSSGGAGVTGGSSQGPPPTAATWTLPAWPAPLGAAALGARTFPVPAPGELPVHGGPLPAALRSAPAFGASVFGLPGAGCMELASPPRGSSRVVTFEELKRAASSASSGGVTRSAGGGHAAVTSAATFSPSIDSAAAGAAAPPAAQLLSRQSACGALALDGGLPAVPLSGLTGWQPPRLPPFNAAAIDATADITLGNNKATATAMGAACQQAHLSPTLDTAEPFPPGCYPVIPSPGTAAAGEASGATRPAASPQPPRGSPGLSRHLTSGVYRLGPDVLPAPRASHPGHAAAASPPQARGLPAPTAAGGPPLPSMISMLGGGDGRAPGASAVCAAAAAWPAAAPAAAAAPPQQVGWDLLLNFPGSGADGSLAMALEPSRGSLSGSSLPGQASGPAPMALGDSRVLATVAHGLGMGPMLEGAGEAGPRSYDLIDALLRSNNNSWEELGAAQQVALMDSECANFLC